jgi:hypothetical protein
MELVLALGNPHIQLLPRGFPMNLFSIISQLFLGAFTVEAIKIGKVGPGIRDNFCD